MKNLLAILLFFICINVSATDLIIEMKNGSTKTYKISDLQTITFSVFELNINANNELYDNIDCSFIRKIYFNNITTGDISGSAINKVNIYPNPTSGELNFQNIPNNVLHFQIMDLSGSKVSEGTFLGNSHTINISSFKEGIYFIVIENHLHKIIKL